MSNIHPHAALLKELGMKTTPKRLAILKVLEREHRYQSPEEVWKQLKRTYPRLGLPTVYRNLEELEGRGVIARVLHANRQLYYYFCGRAGHHHHFVCMKCKGVEDVSFCAMRAMEKEIERRIRGKVTSHILQLNGLCGACAEKTA